MSFDVCFVALLESALANMLKLGPNFRPRRLTDEMLAAVRYSMGFC